MGNDGRDNGFLSQTNIRTCPKATYKRRARGPVL
jgi:hypothetical protein